jgi:hypothetical protein
MNKAVVQISALGWLFLLRRFTIFFRGHTAQEELTYS